MLQFKACQRCRGDMHVSSDIYGEYKECLQCGQIVDIEKSSVFSLAPAPAAATAVKKKRQAA